MSARGPALAAVLLLALVEPAGSGAQQAPVYRADPGLVPVTFLAVAEDGRPIPDLKPEEVSLRIDNRERRVASLQFVRLASANIGGGPAPTPLAPPYGTNRLLDAGRTILLVVAHESIAAGKERPAVEAAVRFVSALSPRDRVALVLVPRGRADAYFTSDRGKVIADLNRVVGQAPDNPSQSDLLCRTRLTLHGTTALLRSLAPLDGPKTVVLMASGLMPPRRDAPARSSRATRAPAACEPAREDYENVGVSASLARAHFYILQTGDLRLDGERPPSDAKGRADPAVSGIATDGGLDGLQNLARVTGGEFFRLAAVPADTFFERVGRESSGYYLAAFEPDAPERDGQPHRVAVSVLRGRATVRSGSHVLVPRPAAAPVTTTPLDFLRVPQLYRDLEMRITAYPSRDGAGPGVRIVALAGPVEPSTQLAGVAFAVFGADGRLIARSTMPKRELSASPLVAAIPVSPGAYRLRVAALDSAGRPGTADFELDARLTDAGPLRASGLALGVERGGSFEPRLEFGEEAAAVVYLELYGRMPRAEGVSVTMEIGETPDGPPLDTVLARVSRSASDPDRHVAMAAVPIDGLLPGDFVVRAVISVDGTPVGRVLRTLRKTAS